jgi:choice-of-anchor A domain-containing protein
MKRTFNPKGLVARKALGVMLAILLVGCLASSAYAFIDLGDAGPQNWVVLTVNGLLNEQGSSVIGLPAVGVKNGNVDMSGTSQIQGNLIVNGGNVDMQGTSHIGGNLFTTGGLTQSAGSSVGGTTTTGAAPNALLDSAVGTAGTKSAAFALLANTQATIAVVDSTTTINRTTTQNVVTITGGINLSGSNKLTIQGNPGDTFIINIPAGGLFNLSGTSSIDVVGISPLDVVFNWLGTGTVADPAKATGNDIEGILLAINADFALDIDGFKWTGEIIAKSLDMRSNSTLENPVPVPPTAILLGSGLLGLALLGGRRKWFHKS